MQTANEDVKRLLDTLDEIAIDYTLENMVSGYGLPLEGKEGGLRAAVIAFRDEAVAAERARCLALVRKLFAQNENAE